MLTWIYSQDIVLPPQWLIYGRAGISFSNIFVNQEANHYANVDSFSGITSPTGGRFGAGIAYQLSNHFGAAVDYYYSYQPTTSLNFNDRTTIYRLDSSMNYVRFSLFYTV